MPARYRVTCQRHMSSNMTIEEQFAAMYNEEKGPTDQLATPVASQDVRNDAEPDPLSWRIRYKDMTPEQKKQNACERQERFRARHPDRVRSYKNPEKYPREPLPKKEKKPRPPRLAKDRPYTDEEKEARRVYMAEYRAKKREVSLVSSVEHLEPPDGNV